MKNGDQKNADARFPVFHVPHDGWQFPPELLDSVCIPEEIFLRYHRIMRDTGVSRMVPEIYRGGDMCEVFRISRLLCDVERFIGPEEIMERYGMGFCYEKAFDGAAIKRVTAKVREQTLKYYREHHARMDRICDRHSRILLIDLHSYSDEIVPTDFLKEGRPPPGLCIGADERYTPPELVETVKKRYAEAGFSTDVNYPYSGCYIPNAVWYGKSSCDCIGIMLEHHKRIYCDEQGRPVPEKLARIREMIRKIITDWTEPHRRKNTGNRRMNQMEIRKIYFDMDGVLADFEKGIRELCHMEPQPQNGKRDKRTDDLMWEAIGKIDRFYDRLDLMPGAKEMFDTVYGKYGDRCEILTGIPREERGLVTAAEDKITWTCRLLSENIKVNAVCRKHKINFCTGPEAVLIDDREKTIKEWQDKGGTAVLHTSPEETIRELEKLDLL